MDLKRFKGVQIGDYNTQNNYFTIQEAKRIIPIPSQLPYLHNRDTQINLLSEQDNKFSTQECIKFLLARGILYDAPEEFGNRIRDQLLQTQFNITVQRAANASFREASSAEDMVNIWVTNLRNSMCNAEGTDIDPIKYIPPKLSTKQQWRQILESIDDNQDGYVFINTVVETSRCLSMSLRFWRHWQQEVSQQFEQLKHPGRIIIYIALTPPRTGWLSMLDRYHAKRIYHELTSYADQRGLVAMSPFGRVTKYDALKWNEEYFIPWFSKNAAETLQREPQEISVYMRKQIRLIFDNSSDIYLADLADRLTKIWNKKISSY